MPTQPRCPAVRNHGNQTACPALEFRFADPFPLKILFQLAELGAKPMLRTLRQADTLWMDDKPDEGQPLGTTVNFAVVVQRKTEVLRKPFLAFVPQCVHFLQRTKAEHIVHIAQAMAYLLRLLHPMVEFVEIDIAEILAGQVADRQAFARLGQSQILRFTGRPEWHFLKLLLHDIYSDALSRSFHGEGGLKVDRAWVFF